MKSLNSKNSGVFLAYETLTFWKLSSLRLKAKILLNSGYSYEKWEGTDVNLCQQLVDEHRGDHYKWKCLRYAAGQQLIIAFMLSGRKLPGQGEKATTLTSLQHFLPIAQRNGSKSDAASCHSTSEGSLYVPVLGIIRHTAGQSETCRLHKH